MILVRIAVTARKALCLVSSSFLPAERNWPSASNGSAAWAFCSAVSDFLVPNQVNWTRQAAIVVRSRSAGVVSSVPVRPLVDRRFDAVDQGAHGASRDEERWRVTVLLRPVGRRMGGYFHCTETCQPTPR